MVAITIAVFRPDNDTLRRSAGYAFLSRQGETVIFAQLADTVGHSARKGFSGMGACDRRRAAGQYAGDVAAVTDHLAPCTVQRNQMLTFAARINRVGDAHRS